MSQKRGKILDTHSLEEERFISWLTFSVYGQLAPRQEGCGGRAWQRKAAHLTVARNHSERGGAGEDVSRSFQITAQGPASSGQVPPPNGTPVNWPGDGPTNEYSAPVIHSPASAHEIWGDVLDLNHNRARPLTGFIDFSGYSAPSVSPTNMRTITSLSQRFALRIKNVGKVLP